MQDNLPPVRIGTTIQYEKELKNLRKKYRSIECDTNPLTEKLENGEIPGDKISSNKYPVYKVRVKNSNINKGQSGGYRVIYYTMTPEAVVLTAIYFKLVQENMSNEEIETRIEQYELEVEQQKREILTIDLPENVEDNE
jgi:mRNA-degrading endonuclease RelE of RelBE toxin-antitoxin system